MAVHLRAQVHELATPHGIPGVPVDGNDALAVRAAADAAVARARAGDGPTLLECATYRWGGHYVGDPERYRSKEEVAAWRGRDPLPRAGGGRSARRAPPRSTPRWTLSCRPPPSVRSPPPRDRDPEALLDAP